MIRPRRLALFGLATFAIVAPPGNSNAQAPASSNVVRRIDHIRISSTKAKELFLLLSETFQFPIAWPLSDYGAFASGGVAVGNVNLEIIRSSEPPTAAANAHFTGLALEPEPLRTSLAELDARRIPHGPPAPFRSRRLFAPSATLWTTVALPSVSSDTVEVFLCDYPDDLPARRQRLGEQLRSRDGGPLSVQSVREIVYGARDLERMKENWQSLLHPRPPSSSGLWSLGDGPAIRVVAADRDEIQQLILTVKSLEQARRFLEERNLLGSDQPAAVTLAGPLFHGLNITLVEGDAESP